MRIRGRSLPFPPLLTSPPTPSSDPSSASISLFPPKRDSSTKQTGESSCSVKIEQVLHPNGDLLSTKSRASTSFSPPYSTSVSPQVLLKKEEVELEMKGGESFVESRINAQVSIANREINCQDNDLGKPDCTIMKIKKKEGKSVLVKEKKTVRNSSVLLEGSRCSRVNGRGWRCCQPTLVGYLLCEHHLGKGRTRNANNSSRGQLGCTESKRNLSENGSANEVVRKKRNIVPTFKARSIKSLLDDGNGQ